MKKFLLFMAGFLAGICYICLAYGGAFLLSAWFASHIFSGNRSLVLLLSLSILAVVGFYLLSPLFSKKLCCGKYAFPIGAFLAGDFVLLAIPLFKVLEPKRLVEIADGSKELAQNYAYLIMVLIVGITCLVISFLVTVLFAQFRRFRDMSMQLEAQNVQLRAAMEAQQAEIQASAPTSSQETREE